jgi:acetyl esterase/lipase
VPSARPAGWLNNALAVELAYGANDRQKLDFYRAPGSRGAPLMVFIHGGGWKDGDKRLEASNKPLFFTNRGIAFAAINYRLVPSATVETQAADIAESIAWLRANADRLNVDPERILVSGHSAGAQLAALLATDPRYLEAAGVPLRVIRGTLLLDGSGYDVVGQMNAERPVKSVYGDVFGTDPVRHSRLSPLAQAGAPNVGSFLILYVTASDDASGGQSRRLAEALLEAGTAAKAVGIANSNHLKINSDFGLDGDIATGAASRFIDDALSDGRPPDRAALAIRIPVQKPSPSRLAGGGLAFD